MIWNIIFDILGSFFSKVEETQEEGGPPPAGPTIHYTSIHCQASVHILSTLFFSFCFLFLSTKSERARLKIGISYLIFLVLFPKVDGGVNILGKCAFRMFAKRIDHGGICFFIQRHSNNLRQPD